MRRIVLVAMIAVVFAFYAGMQQTKHIEFKVTAKTASLSGVLSLLESIVECHEHGGRDDGALDAMLLRVHSCDFVATCGSLAIATVEILRLAGYEARAILFLTLDEWDDVNNGHTVIEFRHDGRWVIADMTFRRLWAFDGRAFVAGAWRTQRPLRFGADTAMYRGDDPTRDLALYARWAHVLIIQDRDEDWYFDSAHSEAARITQYPYSTFLPTEQFDRFYPPDDFIQLSEEHHD